MLGVSVFGVPYSAFDVSQLPVSCPSMTDSPVRAGPVANPSAQPFNCQFQL